MYIHFLILLMYVIVYLLTVNIISLKETGVLISYLCLKRRQSSEWKSTVEIDIWITVTSWISHSKRRYQAVSRSSTTNKREMKDEYPDNPDIWSFLRSISSIFVSHYLSTKRRPSNSCRLRSSAWRTL